MKKEEENGIILANKLRGETMGELTRRVRREQSLSPDEKITFAGRLDPLASGLVIFLSGDKRFERESFLALSKSYNFEIVFGVKTDTGDPLGLVTSALESEIDINILKKSLLSFIGEQTQEYPNFSSKTVGGKPLFQHAREGREVKLPERKINIFSLELVSLEYLSAENFINQTFIDIDLVKGDFRQQETKERWKEVAKELPKELYVATCRLECSSGTYVRVLASDIARKLGSVALARHIHRTHMDEFTNL